LNSFEYGDKEIGFKEIAVGVASMILGVSIITLPRGLAARTNGSDGWISILITGVIACLAASIIAALVNRFPRQSFFQYTSRIVSKPIAYVITFLFGLYFLALSAFVIRMTANISSMYLFVQTPKEVLVLTFLLVTVYAVAGTRVAILRLNLMFMPIVLVVAAGVVLMNFSFFDYENLWPLLTTDWKDSLLGIRETMLSFIGIEVVLFYAMYMNRPKKVGKASIIGIGLITLLYLFIYVFCIGVFSNEVTQNIIYPTVELAREVQVPGQFFERFESIFFTVWLMTIFNTATMAYDIALMSFRWIFRKGKKIVYLSILSPIILLTAMTPPTLVDSIRLGTQISYAGVFFSLALPIILLLIAKVRGVKGDG